MQGTWLWKTTAHAAACHDGRQCKIVYRSMDKATSWDSADAAEGGEDQGKCKARKVAAVAKVGG